MDEFAQASLSRYKAWLLQRVASDEAYAPHPFVLDVPPTREISPLRLPLGYPDLYSPEEVQTELALGQALDALYAQSQAIYPIPLEDVSISIDYGPDAYPLRPKTHASISSGANNALSTQVNNKLNFVGDFAQLQVHECQKRRSEQLSPPSSRKNQPTTANQKKLQSRTPYVSVLPPPLPTPPPLTPPHSAPPHSTPPRPDASTIPVHRILFDTPEGIHKLNTAVTPSVQDLQSTTIVDAPSLSAPASTLRRKVPDDLSSPDVAKSLSSNGITYPRHLGIIPLGTRLSSLRRIPMLGPSIKQAEKLMSWHEPLAKALQQPTTNERHPEIKLKHAPLSPRSVSPKSAIKKVRLDSLKSQDTRRSPPDLLSSDTQAPQHDQLPNSVLPPSPSVEDTKWTDVVVHKTEVSVDPGFSEATAMAQNSSTIDKVPDLEFASSMATCGVVTPFSLIQSVVASKATSLTSSRADKRKRSQKADVTSAVEPINPSMRVLDRTQPAESPPGENEAPKATVNRAKRAQVKQRVDSKSGFQVSTQPKSSTGSQTETLFQINRELAQSTTTVNLPRVQGPTSGAKLPAAGLDTSEIKLPSRSRTPTTTELLLQETIGSFSWLSFTTSKRPSTRALSQPRQSRPQEHPKAVSGKRQSLAPKPDMGLHPEAPDVKMSTEPEVKLLEPPYRGPESDPVRLLPQSGTQPHASSSTHTIPRITPHDVPTSSFRLLGQAIIDVEDAFPYVSSSSESFSLASGINNSKLRILNQAQEAILRYIHNAVPSQETQSILCAAEGSQLHRPTTPFAARGRLFKPPPSM